MGDTLLVGYKKKTGDWEPNLKDVVSEGNVPGIAPNTHWSERESWGEQNLGITAQRMAVFLTSGNPKS